MKYDIYFHDDFDGRASSAVLLNFFSQKMPDVRIANFLPVNYPLPDQWKQENFFEKKNSYGGKGNLGIVVDFRYHPQASIWFDHHPTTFQSASQEHNFKKDKLHDWSPVYASCCRQVIEVLAKNFKYEPPAHIKELGYWLDIVDGANYENARQAIFMEEPALRIARYIENESRAGKKLLWLIKALSAKPIEEIVKDNRIISLNKRVSAKTDALLTYYRTHSEIRDAIAITDLVGIDGDLRFAPYFLFPSIAHAVSIKKRGEKLFHVTVGANPWKRHISKIHLGNIVKKYGGGGHQYVGGCEATNYKDAKKIVDDIIKKIS